MNARTEDGTESENIVRFDPVSFRENETGVHVAWLRLPGLPLEKDLRGRLVEVLAVLHARVERVAQQRILHDVYLQMTQLERPSGALLISQKGSCWLPEIGLGVWPDREPPQPINEDDFKKLPPGGRLRETTYQIARIGAREESMSLEVIHEMAGTGALLVVMAAEDWGSEQHDAISQRLDDYMTAEAYRGYPMYFPLVDANSIGKMSRGDFEALLPDVLVYIREDITENALLIVSRIPFEELFPEKDAKNR